MTLVPSGGDTLSMRDPEPLIDTRPATTELTLYDLINIVLAHRRLLVMLPLILVVVVVAYTLVRSRTYASDASFMPRTSENSLAKLGGLAAQFGVAVDAGARGESPAFYANLVQSREILGPVVDSSYTMSPDASPRRGTLIDLFDVRAGRPAERREKALRELADRLSVSTQLETGLVRVQATTEDPSLSQQIVERILTEVSAFNLRRRRAQAASERVFLEERLGQLRGELQAAEQRRAAFLERNRGPRNAPQLAVQSEQFDRDVSVSQAVFTSFAQAYEQAKIDEVRNTPIITVVVRPEIPTGPERRRILLKIALALIGGATLAVLIALITEFFRRARREDPEGAARFAALRAEIASPLHRVGRGSSN